MELVTSTVMQFSFFIVFALLGTILSLRVRQPYVVGLLAIGMIAGPNVFGWVQDTNLIETFSELGAILLLFTIGVEFSVSRIIRAGFRAVLITAFKMGVLFLFAYEAALYMGFDLTSALYVGAMLSITSTAILFKIVKEKGMGKNPILPLLFSMLIVEDIVAVGALTFFSSLGTGAPTYEDKFYSIALSLALLGGFYLIVRKPAASAVFHLTSTLNEEVMIFVAFSLCLAMSVIAAFFGLAPSIGAFLAGSIVSQLPNSRRIEKAIKPLLLMFAALFFLSLGMRIDPNIVASNFVFAVELTALFISVCFLSVLVMLYITGAKLQNAVFGASAMVVLGEFSLLIASIAPGKLGTLLLSVGSFGVMATSLVSSALLDRQQLLLSFGRLLVPSLLYKPIKKLSAYFTGLLRDFSPGGSFWQISRAFWVMTRRQLGIIALIAVLTMALRAAAVHSGLAAGEAGFSLRLAILAVGLLPIIYLSIGILKEFTIVLDALSRSIARHKRNAKDESIILRDLTAGSLLIIIAILLPDAVSTLSLPSFFNFADEVLLVFAFAFAWDLFRHAGRLRIRAE